MAGTLTYETYEWHHDFADEPVRMYVELDANRWEVRKVEVFRDGQLHYATENVASGPTQLGDVPVPPLDEILMDVEFSGRSITRADFEQAWQAAIAERTHTHTGNTMGTAISNDGE